MCSMYSCLRFVSVMNNKKKLARPHAISSLARTGNYYPICRGLMIVCCKIYFVFFIFVVCANHENIFTTKISRSTVVCVYTVQMHKTICSDVPLHALWSTQETLVVMIHYYYCCYYYYCCCCCCYAIIALQHSMT